MVHISLLNVSLENLGGKVPFKKCSRHLRDANFGTSSRPSLSALEIKFKWGNDKKEAAVKFLALFLNTKTAFSKPCSTQIQALPSHSKLSNANNWQFGFHTFWHLTTLIESDLFQIFHRCSNRCDKLSEGRSCFIFLFLLDKWMLDSRVHKAEVKRWKQFILVALSYSSVPRYTSQ